MTPEQDARWLAGKGFGCSFIERRTGLPTEDVKRIYDDEFAEMKARCNARRQGQWASYQRFYSAFRERRATMTYTLPLLLIASCLLTIWFTP